MAKKAKGGKLTSSAECASQHGLFLLDDETPGAERDRWFNPVVNGEIKGHGLVPRDYATFPEGMFAPPSEMPIVPRGEWESRLAEQERQQSSLWHVRMAGAGGQMIPSLDQNGQGFCWAYSTTATVMLVRAVNHAPYVRLSAHSVGCKVMDFRDRGGWCGLSAKFVRENGVVPVSHWPEKSMSRSNDKPEAWAEGAKFKITEDWVDLARQEYDQNLTFDQVASCMLLNVPCAVDFNHWSHSVCAIRLVRVESGSYGLEILNSWTDQWGAQGTGILRGGKAIPDGAIATRAVPAG